MTLMMNSSNEALHLAGPVAVFGAGGFIGANLVHELIRHRKDVFALTHQPFVPWRLADLPLENIVHCDVRDAAQVARVMQRHGFRTVFYLAAYGAYARQSDARRIYETNFVGFLNVAEQAAELGAAAVVHAGSSSEYGTNSTGPSEDSALCPNSHYSVSKISASYLVQYLGRHRRLPVVNLRFYSVYGPWEDSDRLIPQLIEYGEAGKYPPLADPETSRDFVYVEDAVKACVSAAARAVRTHPGASLNIGSGTKTTLRDLAELAGEMFQIPTPPQWGSMSNHPWDLKDWYANPERATEVFQWKTETSLAEGLRRTREWMVRHRPFPRVETGTVVPEPTRISAVIACYKDAPAIPHLHERLVQVFREIQVDYEIIFVNDASPDDTDQVLEELCRRDPRVIAIEHSRSFGSQSAFLDGISVSTGDAVVLMDGDLQDPPEVIPEFYRKWREGYEVVYGRRVKRNTNFIMAFCYKAFYRVFRYLSYVSIPVDAGDFSMIDRKVTSQLARLPERNQFLRGLRAWVGFRQTGVDYVRPERPFGRSTNNWHKNFWWARKAIFNFSFVPLETMMYGGMALTALSFLALIAQIIGKILDPTIPHGVTTIITLILFFGGLNLLGLSILGEYLGKIFDETKRRPRFIRRAIRQGVNYMTTAEDIQSFLDGRAGRQSEGITGPH